MTAGAGAGSYSPTRPTDRGSPRWTRRRRPRGRSETVWSRPSPTRPSDKRAPSAVPFGKASEEVEDTGVADAADVGHQARLVLPQELDIVGGRRSQGLER